MHYALVGRMAHGQSCYVLAEWELRAGGWREAAGEVGGAALGAGAGRKATESTQNTKVGKTGNLLCLNKSLSNIKASLTNEQGSINLWRCSKKLRPCKKNSRGLLNFCTSKSSKNQHLLT